MNDKKQPSFDPFENFLTQQFYGQKPYLDDNGFTASLMEQLPQHKPLATWVVRLILLLPLTLVVLFIMHQFGLNSLVAGFYKAAILLSPKSFVLGAIGMSIGLMVATVGWMLNQLRVI